MSSEMVSFSEIMIKSNVSTYPWQLCIPRKFGAHFPCQKDYVTLVDENDREYWVMFLVNFVLGRGWRDFVTAQGLLEGDKVSFHVINRGKFKVHITRASRFIENELQNNVPMGFGKRKDLAEEPTCFGDSVTNKYLVSCAGGGHLKDGMLSQNQKRALCKEKVHITRFTENEVQKYVPVRLGKRINPTAENTSSGNTVTKKKRVSCAVNCHQMMKDRMLCQIKKKVHEIERMVSKEKVYIRSRNRSTGTKGSDGSSHVNFYACPNIDEPTPLKGQSVVGENSEFALRFEDFKIVVDGETLDSEIPSAVRKKYYQLCCGQKKFIHDGVVKGIDNKFAVSVVLEIVRIADSVKVANISTAPHVLECMGKTLKFYHEDLGFAVGSLRAKISKLTEFSSAHQALEEKKRKLCVMFNKEAGLTW